MNQQLFTTIDRYIEDLFSMRDEALEAALESAAAANMPQVNVSPNQGKLLYLLALMCGARNILEIGTLAGYSAICMGRALPADGRLITVDYNAEHAAIARTNLARAGLDRQVEVRQGHALDILAELEREGAGPFDMIFIDADKPPYTDYLAWSLRLARPGTLIIADNVIRSGEVLNTESTNEDLHGIQRFNIALSQEPRVAATILPVVGIKGYDGLAIAVVQR